MEKRIISTEITKEDKQIEKSLRPQFLNEYIGQEKIRKNLKVYIDAAKLRKESLDHVLFYGPPGLGKTTLCIRLDLPKFTLVGATTRAGLLTAPLRDRFGVVQKLEFYNADELKEIVRRSATVLGVEIDESGAIEIARRSRGTPRLANRLLKRVRDFAQVKYNGVIDKSVADFALDTLDVDKLGLDNNDRMILLTIIEKFGGGPVGLNTLSAAIGEDAGTLEEVYEPYLLMNGLINRTPGGRVATENAYIHLGIEMKG